MHLPSLSTILVSKVAWASSGDFDSF